MESRIIQTLSEAERKRLAPYFHPVELHLNQQLVEAGDPITSVYFLRDCVTSTIVDTAEGTTIEVGLMGGEGMAGLSLLLGRSVSNTSVIVQIAGSAVRMSAEDFRKHVVEPRGEMFELLLQYADAFMAMVAQTAACNSIHSVDERLARWILMTHDRVNRDELPLTQEFLAYMLGVRRPSVSLAANALQQKGLIEYTRGRMTIKDRPGLEQHVCECYSIVRNITDNLYKGRAAEGRRVFVSACQPLVRDYMICLEHTRLGCDDNVVGLSDRYERPLRMKGAHIMAFRLSDTIPSVTLFKYLTDDNLECVESSEENSIYRYGCGCTAVRWLRSADCYVQWCSAHGPRTARSQIGSLRGAS